VGRHLGRLVVSRFLELEFRGRLPISARYAGNTGVFLFKEETVFEISSLLHVLVVDER